MPALGHRAGEWLPFLAPDHGARLPPGGPLRAARAPGRRRADPRGARPRGADRARVRPRHRLRLHDDRADPDRRRHVRARDRAPPRGVRLGLARADAVRRDPPARSSSSARARRSPTSSGSCAQPGAGSSTSSSATFAPGAGPAAGARRLARAARGECSSASGRTSSCSPRRTSTSVRCSTSSSRRTGTGVQGAARAERRPSCSCTRASTCPGEGVPLFELRPPILTRRRLGRRSGRSTSSSRRARRRARHAALAPRRARDQARLARARCSTSTGGSGVGEREFGMLKFRTMVADAAEQQAELEERQRGVGRAVQDPGRPAGDARRAASSGGSRSTSCRSS